MCVGMYICNTCIRIRVCVYVCVCARIKLVLGGGAQCAWSKPTINFAQLQVLKAWYTQYTHTDYVNTEKLKIKTI